MAQVTAVVWVRSLVWELPHAMDMAKKKKKKLGTVRYHGGGEPELPHVHLNNPPTPEREGGAPFQSP